jgi:hypothetical protein
MTRNVAKQVATTGIDIDKNSLHLLGLEGCFGSNFPLTATLGGRLKLGEHPKQLARNPTFALRLPKLRALLPWQDGRQNGQS